MPTQARSAVTPEPAIARSNERVASYKYLRIVAVVAAMPMTATGKILKRAMRG